MVAGPNGSGKTTLISYLRAQGVELGRYINPDDIAATLSGDYGRRVREAQSLADAERARCLDTRTSFTFETVMSHVSKVEFLQDCKDAGFETVLYFVGTRDPRLNVARVAQRVALGGHDVPLERIVSRYARSLGLLPRALEIADTAYVFDNSGPDDFRLCLSKSRRQGAPAYLLEDSAPEWVRRLVLVVP
jgi:predicted ABC-type ATPase